MSWRRFLPEKIDVLPARLPGREGRLREEPITEFPKLLDSLANGLETMLDVPFAFFGHSLGALIAFELARLLRARGMPTPVLLLVASRSAPHLPLPPPLYGLPKGEFLAAIQDRYGAFDPRLVADPQFLGMFEPILRADFTLFDGYRYAPDRPLGCPIAAFGGARDRSSPEVGLRSWVEHTSGRYSCTIFEGGHFFFERNQAALIDLLDNVTRHLAGCTDID